MLNESKHIKTSVNKANLSQKYVSDIPLPDNCKSPQYKTMIFKNLKYSITLRNSCCMLKDRSIVEIKSIAFSAETNESVIIAQKYTDTSIFFDKPCHSSPVNIFKVSYLGDLSCWPISEICSKLVRLPYKESLVVFPFLHV